MKMVRSVAKVVGKVHTPLAVQHSVGAAVKGSIKIKTCNHLANHVQQGHLTNMVPLIGV